MKPDVQPRLSRKELLAIESDVDFAAAVIDYQFTPMPTN